MKKFENGNLNKNSYSVPPVERAIRLLQYIGEGNKCRNLSKASSHLSIDRTTLIRLIYSLLDNGMIEQISEDEGYCLGIGVISLGAQAIQSRDIVQMSLQSIQELVKKSNMSAHLGILDGTDVVYLTRETPKAHLISNMHIGSRLPAHASSIGRAILADLSEVAVKDIYKNSELSGGTNKAPQNLQQILSQRKIDVKRGYVWSVGMIEPNIGSCAATIYNHEGMPIAGLNVSGPKDIFIMKTQNRQLLLEKLYLTLQE
jgi:DNA-binding IclR family transcriptional regulator